MQKVSIFIWLFQWLLALALIFFLEMVSFYDVDWVATDYLIQTLGLI
jgi:hypothetical protein